MRLNASVLSFFVILASVLIAGCSDSSTNPPVGSGDFMEATVNGTVLSLDVVTDPTGYNTYDVAGQEVRFAGTEVGPPIKTITLRFNYDLDRGGIPHTLNGSEVEVIYVESDGATTHTYSCPVGSLSCTITLTATNGTTVDGIFGASLTDTQDQTRRVTISNGRFSVRLKRQ